MPRSIPPELEPWIEQLAPALGLTAEEVPTNLLLGLTGQVAHGVTRPAAPVTTYLMGLAVAAGIDPREATRVVKRELAVWEEAHPQEDDA
ncbi:DUF6457 domain-containing protein [Brachybacterium sp. ACRRE]|uniref:DUF6457 domain-containing protein n=1 Tax=Brachybacterium sp. ACRRE TaxID=2918184 RepID=UPI001EF28BBC|nr:DUF6457 domain-containing protein [Brachybacterium sp. ACRRE]MCG7308523.1 DUF6457 domain-containing protein [Brachybacterium sp. ACRRE]